jgi:hypothetical protein
MTISLYYKAPGQQRPFTAPSGSHHPENGPYTKNNWLKQYEKLPAVPEEGADGAADIKDTRLPDFKPPASLSIPTRTCQDGFKQEHIREIESIKDKLAKDKS